MYTGLGAGLLVDLWCAVPGNSGLDRCIASKPSDIPMPPTVKPPADWETGATGHPAAETINEILDRQWREWMEQNRRYMEGKALEEDVTREQGADWVPVALIVGGIAALSLLKK